ncbi:MAG: hypothetical protein M3N47_07145 [Chloroflexota bacterium]|nr:hypothetical protein [Chloroflexota bacterium]
MQSHDVTRRFATLDDRHDSADYNYEHFRTKYLLQDARRTLTNHGLKPSELAPDFTLPEAGGGWLRLSDLIGRPMLLHFGSIT